MRNKSKLRQIKWHRSDKVNQDCIMLTLLRLSEWRTTIKHGLRAGIKAWFSLNVSVLAKNRSCLLMWTYCVLPVSIGTHRKFYCEVSCIQSYVNCVAHPVLSYKKRLFESRCDKIVPCFALFFRKTESIFCFLGSYNTQSQRISSQTSQSLRKVQHVLLLIGARRILLRRLGLLVSIDVYTSEGIERRRVSC